MAAAGFYVVVSDFFHGDPYVLDSNPPRPVAEWVQNHGTVCPTGLFHVDLLFT